MHTREHIPGPGRPRLLDSSCILILFRHKFDYSVSSTAATREPKGLEGPGPGAVRGGGGGGGQQKQLVFTSSCKTCIAAMGAMLTY